jgi:hypothetical protein
MHFVMVSAPALHDELHSEVNWRKQAFAQACAVCSPKTKVRKQNRDISPAIH